MTCLKVLLLERLRKTLKASVRVSGNLTETRDAYLGNTCLGRYRVTILVAETSIMRLESIFCCLVTDKYFIQVVCSLLNGAVTNLDRTASSDSMAVDNESERM
jgi:hypothetical protein